MAINKNHEFEEVDGVKCAIVEKNTSPARAAFLKKILEFNGYTVVIAATPLPKAAPVKPAATVTEPAAIMEGDASPPLPPPPPETFTVGVTDLTFNSTNAIFGRLLRTPDGHVVTLKYWQQIETEPHDEIPYFTNRIY